MPKIIPMPVRLNQALRSLLAKGAKQTRHSEQQLIRMTLDRHLSQVIAKERITPSARITTIGPWPKGALAKAYRRIGNDWDRTEAAAAAAQSKPAWED